METDATFDRLDKIIAILRIAHADKIDALRTTVRRALIVLGALEKRGDARATIYRSTGLL